MERKAHIVVDAGFGDQGKGVTLDTLAREFEIKMSVRFGGGSQPAHHMTLPNGIVHCFRQISSAAFIPGMISICSREMLINPLNLILEAQSLEEKGVPEPLKNVYISENCLIITPMHFVINQMLESSRGDKRHGSVGMGVGQTIAMAKECPEKAIVAGDLKKNAVLRGKLLSLWRRSKDIAQEIFLRSPDNPFLQEKYKFIHQNVISDLVEKFTSFALESGVHIVSDCELQQMMDKEEHLIFEGTQGILLDPTFGFPPHITKTNTTSRNALKIIGDSIAKKNIIEVGVIRAYSTRHGAGPFVTEREWLGKIIKDVNNQTHPWQGTFRIGWLDLLATRYAIDCNNGIDELSVTNLDQFNGFSDIKVCNSYEYLGKDLFTLSKFFEWEYFFGSRIRILKFKKYNPENNMFELTKLLFECIPLDYIVFPGWKGLITKNLPREAIFYLDFLSSKRGLDVPVSIVSIGPSWVDKINYKSL